MGQNSGLRSFICVVRPRCQYLHVTALRGHVLAAAELYGRVLVAEMEGRRCCNGARERLRTG